MAKGAPPRSYRTIIESLAQVWRIEHVDDVDAIWTLGTPEREALDPGALRIAVWNMFKGSGGILFEHDFRSLCYRSDVVLAQEALLSQRGLQTFCERGFQAVHAASYKRRDGLRDGVLIAARASARLPQRRILCKFPEPLLRTPKTALCQTFDLDGTSDRLMVVNLHATLIRRKAAAVEEMEHLVTHIPAHEGPLLLAGDFNTFTPGYLTAVTSVLRHRLGLEIVRIPDDPRPATQALDQIFTRGLATVRVRIDTTIKNSDHFPILGEFRL